MANRGTLGSLFIDLAANTATFETDMGRAARVADQRSREMRKAFTDAAQDIAGALASIEIAHKIEEAFKGVIDNADRVGKAAQKVGLTTEALSGLKYAANLADVQFDQLTSGLEKFDKATVAARAHNSDQARAFGALGISLTDANGKLKTNQELLLEVADRFSKTKDGADKTAISMALFGKAGAELIPFLNQGRDGIGKLTDEAQRLGVVIDEKTSKAAEQFNENLKRVHAAAEGLTTRVVAGLLPTMKDLSEQWVKYSQNADNVERATRAIDAGLKVLTYSGLATASTFLQVGTIVGGVAAFWDRIGQGNKFSDLAAGGAILKQAFSDAGKIGVQYHDQMVRLWEDLPKAAAASSAGVVEANNKEALSFKTAAQAAEEHAAALKKEEEFKKALALYDHELFERDLADVKALEKAHQEQERAALEAAARVMRPERVGSLSSRMSADPTHASAIRDEGVKEENDFYRDQLKRFQQNREAIEKEYGSSNLVIERAESQHQQRLKLIEKDAQQARLLFLTETLDASASVLSAAADLQDKGSRAGFERYKKFEIASAIIATISAAIKTYESLAYINPYVAAAGAAAAAAAGFAQVQQIRNQSFEGRRFGGNVNAGGMYEVAEGGNPELLRLGNRTIMLMGQQSGNVEPAKVVSGGGGSAWGMTNVNVHIYGGGPDSQARVGSGPNGMELEVFVNGIENRLANNAALGRGPLVKTYREVFNLQRQGS